MNGQVALVFNETNRAEVINELLRRLDHALGDTDLKLAGSTINL